MRIKTVALASCAAVLSVFLWQQQSINAAETKISRLEKAADAYEIQNIVGLYSIYVISNQWIELGNLFALDDPDVYQSVPREMRGPELRKYFTERDAQKLEPGVMHQHSFLAPVIIVADDGLTAKGSWDSLGIDTGSGNNMARWAWVRYNIDFKKIEGEWKIWHLQVKSVWRADYGESWAEMVQQATKGEFTGGGEPGAYYSAAEEAAAAQPAAGGNPPPGMAGNGAPAGAPGGAPAGGQQENRWRYSGADDTPQIPENVPAPYSTFDADNAYLGR